MRVTGARCVPDGERCRRTSAAAECADRACLRLRGENVADPTHAASSFGGKMLPVLT